MTNLYVVMFNFSLLITGYSFVLECFICKSCAIKQLKYLTKSLRQLKPLIK